MKGWNDESEKWAVRKAFFRTVCATAVIFILSLTGMKVQLAGVGEEETGKIMSLFQTRKENKGTETDTTQEVEVNAMENTAAVPDTINEFIFWDSGSRYLNEEEVRALPEEDLAKARNELYARKGRVFTGGKWEEYFNSISWYEGTISAEDFNENEIFNDFEKKNRDLIVRIEKEK